MTAGARYAAGVAAVAAGALLVSAALPAPDERAALRIALAVALPVQGPLGWWVVRALGTERLLLVWGVGLLARATLLAAAAWVLAPLARVPLGALLLALAALLLALLTVEVVVLSYRVRHIGVK